MVQLPQVPHVPIKYWSIGLFSFLTTLDELSNWVTFTYGHTRYEYWGIRKSDPQKQLGYSAWIVSGPNRMLVVHTGTRLAEGVAVPERVPVLIGVLLRVARGERVGVLVLDNDFVPAEVAVNDRDMVDDGVTVPLAEEELDALELPLDDPELEKEADDDELLVDVGLRVLVELNEGVEVRVELVVNMRVPDLDKLTVDVGLPDTDEESEDAGLPDTDELNVEEGVPDEDELPVDEGLPDTDELTLAPVCVPDVDCVLLVVAENVADMVGDW